jgi:hypothetical protein
MIGWRWAFNPVRTMPDDRGVEVQIDRNAATPSDTSDLSVDMPATHPGLLRQIIQISLSACVAIVVFALLLRCLYNIGALVAAHLSMPGWVGGVTAIAFFFGWITHSHLIDAYLPWTRERARRTLADLIAWRLRVGFCGACAHCLENLPVEEDGCTRCPECGAAWRMDAWNRDRVHDPAPPELWGHPQRGRRHRLIDARNNRCLAWSSRSSHDVRAKFGELRRQSWFLPRRFLAYVGVLAFAGIAMTLALVVSTTPPITAAEATVIALTLVLVAIALVIHHVGHVRAIIHERFLAEHVSRGTCPQCEHPLRATPAISDGALLCDRCGAAWKPASPATPRQADPRMEPGSSRRTPAGRTATSGI